MAIAIVTKCIVALRIVLAVQLMEAEEALVDGGVGGEQWLDLVEGVHPCGAARLVALAGLQVVADNLAGAEEAVEVALPEDGGSATHGGDAEALPRGSHSLFAEPHGQIAEEEVGSVGGGCFTKGVEGEIRFANEFCL